MTARQAMSPLRRRPIPGMTQVGTAASPAAEPAQTPAPHRSPDRPTPAPAAPQTSSAVVTAPADQGHQPDRSSRRRSGDYSATRLVNFRLPVDLHDRYRQLVQEIEREYPRLRRPSLTEVIIGLLEEGPTTVDEVAAVIRRKRTSEYSEEADA